MGGRFIEHCSLLPDPHYRRRIEAGERDPGDGPKIFDDRVSRARRW
jgi:hypothetical protein